MKMKEMRRKKTVWWYASVAIIFMVIDMRKNRNLSLGNPYRNRMGGRVVKGFSFGAATSMAPGHEKKTSNGLRYVFI